MSEDIKGIAAVTGAGGFIGSHLVEDLLSNGYRVRAFFHYNALNSKGHLKEVEKSLGEEQRVRLELHSGDITDGRSVREFVEGADCVLHLAALIGIPYSYLAPQSYVSVNVTGTLNVLEACRDAGTPRLLHTSTSEVYGTALTTPMNEQHPLQAQSPYSATKIAADKLVESYHLSYGLPAVIVRPFNTYGPRQSLRAVIPTIIAQALSKDCEEIKLGSLDPVRDFTYVTDTAAAYRHILEAGAEKTTGKVYNLGSNEGISMGSLAELILKTLEIEKPIVPDEERIRPEKSEVRTLISDNRRVRTDTGWKPSVDLEAGIRQTAESIKKASAQIDASAYAR